MCASFAFFASFTQNSLCAAGRDDHIVPALLEIIDCGMRLPVTLSVWSLQKAALQRMKLFGGRGICPGLGRLRGYLWAFFGKETVGDFIRSRCMSLKERDGGDCQGSRDKGYIEKPTDADEVLMGWG